MLYTYLQVTTNNVTQCCVQQNVTAGCLDACSSSYLDINVAIARTDCFNDFDKLMKCASGMRRFNMLSLVHNDNIITLVHWGGGRTHEIKRKFESLGRLKSASTQY